MFIYSNSGKGVGCQKGLAELQLCNKTETGLKWCVEGVLHSNVFD